MAEIINVEEARAYAREHWPSPVVRRPLEALLDDCPRVEAEPVSHGRWMWVDGYCLCSICKLMGTVIREHPDGPLTAITEYCPRCGAKMDGGAE